MSKKNNDLPEYIEKQKSENITLIGIDSRKDYSETRPAKLIAWGTEHSVSSWRELYVLICKELYILFPEKMLSIQAIKPYGMSGILYYDIDQDSLIAPEEIAPGSLLETNKDTNTIINNIRKMLDYCQEAHSNIKILICDIRKKREDTSNEVLVSLNRSKYYTNTKPTRFILWGEEYFSSSWRKLYESVCCLIFIKHSDCLINMLEDKSGNICNFIVKGDVADRLKVPREIADGLYIDVNKDTRTIINNIRKIMDACDESYETLKIYCISTVAEVRR